MHCGEKLWDSDITMNKWKEIVSSHPDSPILWNNYINFCLSNFRNFTISSLRDIFSKAIAVINKQKKHYQKGNEKNRSLEYRQMMILISACWIELQSGYMERAISIFQGFIELNFFCPNKLKDANIDSLLSFFKNFLGRRGSKIWRRKFKRME